MIAKYPIYWTHSKNEYYIFRFHNTTNGISNGIYYQDQDYENKITQECHTNYDGKTYLAINNSLLNGWFTQNVFCGAEIRRPPPIPSLSEYKIVKL